MINHGSGISIDMNILHYHRDQVKGHYALILARAHRLILYRVDLITPNMIVHMSGNVEHILTIDKPITLHEHIGPTGDYSPDTKIISASPGMCNEYIDTMDDIGRIDKVKIVGACRRVDGQFCAMWHNNILYRMYNYKRFTWIQMIIDCTVVMEKLLPLGYRFWLVYHSIGADALVGSMIYKRSAVSRNGQPIPVHTTLIIGNDKYKAYEMIPRYKRVIMSWYYPETIIIARRTTVSMCIVIYGKLAYVSRIGLSTINVKKLSEEIMSEW